MIRWVHLEDLFRDDSIFCPKKSPSHKGNYRVLWDPRGREVVLKTKSLILT